VSDRQVNVFDCELTNHLDEHGFAHRGEPLRGWLGAERIGAGLYAAEPGRPIWPYHYHHGVEEWLYVLAGTPVLRDTGGRRRLTAGDLICFPSGHRGAHTMEGPGRFLVLSSGGSPAPSLSAYPDSDKLAALAGRTEIPGLDAIMFVRDGAVGYWHAEGTHGPADPEHEPVRQPASTPGPPVINALTVVADKQFANAPPGFRSRAASVGKPLGATRLGATILDLDPGEGSGPYHYECGREEWLLVLGGTPTLRRPAGEERLRAGDLVCFPDGPDGAHRVINRDDVLARVMFLSTKELPTNICYPDSGKWLMRNGPGRTTLAFREADAVDYWEGER
jgi:uncharacterized cupin superfamily protein